MNQGNQNNSFQSSGESQNNTINSNQGLSFKIPESKESENQQQVTPNTQSPIQGQQPLQPNLIFQMPESKENGNQQQVTLNTQSPIQGQQPLQPNLNFQMPESKENGNQQQVTLNTQSLIQGQQPLQSNLNFQMPMTEINGNIQQPAQNITNTYSNQPTMNNLAQPHDKQKSTKKIVIIASVLILAVVITVIFFLNRPTTLICTETDTSVGMDMATAVTMKFKKDELTGVKVVVTIDLGEYADQKEFFIEKLEESYSSSEYEGIDLKITSDKNKVYVTMKADKNNFEHMGLVTSKTLDEAKKELEEDGYICK